MTTKKDFCAIFGDLAIKFANVEFMVSQLLHFLIDPALPAIGGLLTSKATLQWKLEKARQLAHLRFCRRQDVEDRIKATLQKADQLRDIRNSLIHSNWVLNDADLANDKIKCFDARWKPVKGRYEWVAFDETTYEIAQLNHISEQVGDLVLELVGLLQDLSPITMTGPSTPGSQTKGT